MIEELLDDASHRMDQAVDKAASDFTTVRTGRANPQILNRVVVEYYGTPTPLQQLATMSVPEPRLLVVHPYDKTTINDIENAIRTSDLGLNPSNDGNLVRISFPTLTEERRKELTKLVHSMAEDGKIAIRNIRRSTKSDLEELHGEISDDDIRRAEKELQEITDLHTARIDELLEVKEAELMEV
ncbi:MAG: ribosome recycling factor [Acidimicrobiia bacterium]|nr:ribosome recycling factor [Acidimicrobiia bacterium]